MEQAESDPSDSDDKISQSNSPGNPPNDESLTLPLSTDESGRRGLEAMVLGIRLDDSDRPDSLGRLADYEILNHIGRGGMGMVLRAFDPQLHRNVAIKVMSPDLMASDSARERFFREARSAAGINHPNVVTIHAVSEFKGTPFLVMEFVDGRTLQNRIKADAPMDTLDILRISSQIASGLAAADRHGIIHRDIKPANIMLEDSIERVKITDFGLARVAQERSDLTSLGTMVGTPSFMSPEQVDGLNLDHRSDLFSLGCVMYAMILGHSPFKSSNVIATARRVSTEQHAPLSEVADDVPPYLISVVDRLLQKSPDDRFQSAEEVAQILTRHMAEENRAAGKTDVQQRRVARGRFPDRRYLWLLAVAGIAVAAALIMAFSRSQSPDSDQKLASQSEGTRTEEGALDVLNDGIITVAKDGTGEFRSLTEALRHARDSCTISVLDNGRYDGQLMISDERLHGVHLEAKNGATLTAPDGQPVIVAFEASGVEISGFRFDTLLRQHAIEITGKCPGMTVHDCTFESVSPRESVRATIYLHRGASGSVDDPIRLENLKMICGAAGIAIGGLEDSTPVSSVRIEHCHIRTVTEDFGVPIAMQNQVHNIVVRRNVMTTGMVGITLTFTAASDCADLLIEKNSIHDFPVGVGLMMPSETSEIRISSNLFVKVGTIHIKESSLLNYVTWFDDNWLIPGFNGDVNMLSQAMVIKQPLDFVSLDPNSRDFLRPGTGAPRGMPGHLGPDVDK